MYFNLNEIIVTKKRIQLTGIMMVSSIGETDGVGEMDGTTDGPNHGDWTMAGEEHMTGMETESLIGETELGDGMELEMVHGVNQ